MAVLSDPDRFEVWAHTMRERILSECTIDKVELRDAVNALDVYLDTNAAAINDALPAAAKAALTKKEKAAMLMYVVAKRYDVET